MKWQKLAKIGKLDKRSSVGGGASKRLGIAQFQECSVGVFGALMGLLRSVRDAIADPEGRVPAPLPALTASFAAACVRLPA
eukprot:3231273-Amphidinium_carterae.1